MLCCSRIFFHQFLENFTFLQGLSTVMLSFTHRLQLDAAVACGEWRHACQLEAVVRGAGGGHHLGDLPREDLWPLSGGFLPCFHRFLELFFCPKVWVYVWYMFIIGFLEVWFLVGYWILRDVNRTNMWDVCQSAWMLFFLRQTTFVCTRLLYHI